MNINKTSSIILLLLLAALSLRLIMLDSKQMGVDESFTLKTLKAKWGEFWEIYTEKEANMPFYNVIAKIVYSIGGVIGVRLLSVLFGIGAIYYSAKWVKLGYGDNAAIAITALLSFNPLAVMYSQHMRPYSLLAFLFSAMVYFLYMFKENPSNKKNWITLSIINVLLIYTHYFSILVLFSEFVYLLFEFKNKKNYLKIALKPFFVSVLLFLLWVPIFFKHIIIANSISVYERSFLDLPYVFFKFANGANLSFTLSISPFLLIGTIILNIFFLGGLYWFISNKKDRNLVLSLFFLPIAISGILTLKISYFFHFRHFFCLIPIYLLISYSGILKIQKKEIRFTLFGLTVASWAGVLFLYYSAVTSPNWNVFFGL